MSNNSYDPYGVPMGDFSGMSADDGLHTAWRPKAPRHGIRVPNHVALTSGGRRACWHESRSPRFIIRYADGSKCQHKYGHKTPVAAYRYCWRKHKQPKAIEILDKRPIHHPMLYVKANMTI